MRTWNFGKCRKTAVFFRLFLVTIVALSLVMGGISLNTQPVDAIITVTPSPTIAMWTESMTILPITFTHGPSANPPPFPATPPEVFFFWMWGNIPPGLNLDMNTGVLSGCITPGTPPGSATFWVGCTAVVAVPANVDWSVPLIPNAGQVNWTIIAFPGCTAMVIDPTPIPVAWEGVPFTMANTVTGGVGPYTWGATGLPAGLTIDPGTGLITGTPGPGTCNTINNVTITVTDTSDCFCPPATRPLILFVDCWANYLPIFYYTTSCDFNIEIGPGLTLGQTNVLVDGAHEATLAGGQSQTFTSVPCESHLVMVDQTVQVPNSNTRFSVIGSNIKTVTDVDNYAYFDYAQEVYIQTASEPPGKTQPPGAGYYAVGSNFSSTAPSTIESDIGNGIKYVFWEWQLPDGTTRPNVNLVFTVNQGGTAVAKYKTYYQLILHSEYPAINESSFEPAGSTATWNLSLHAVPLLGLWGFLGGVQSPLNASGSQLMTGPSTVEILWGPNYTMPIIAIIIVLLVIAGLIYLIYRLRAGSTRQATGTGVKEASSKAKETAAENFCPKCGNPVDKDAGYCKKCGKKLK